MLAEAIIVPDGDSFLEEPMDINDVGLPQLPRLTWSQMARLHRDLELLLADESARGQGPTRVADTRLPQLPRFEDEEMVQVMCHIERIMRVP